MKMLPGQTRKERSGAAERFHNCGSLIRIGEKRAVVHLGRDMKFRGSENYSLGRETRYRSKQGNEIRFAKKKKNEIKTENGKWRSSSARIRNCPMGTSKRGKSSQRVLITRITCPAQLSLASSSCQSSEFTGAKLRVFVHVLSYTSCRFRTPTGFLSLHSDDQGGLSRLGEFLSGDSHVRRGR